MGGNQLRSFRGSVHALSLLLALVAASPVFLGIGPSVQTVQAGQDDPTDPNKNASDKEDKKKPKDPKPAKDRLYRKKDIAVARFGDAERRALIEKVFGIDEFLLARIFGQETAIQNFRNSMLTYIENFGSHQGAPVSLHMIGFPGVGKSAMVELVEQLGFKVVTINAQEYAGQETWMIQNKLSNIMAECREAGPCIMMVDELDKVPEITSSGEVTRPLIGTLNEILNSGKFDGYFGDDDQGSFSNIMVVSTMNFSPEELNYFAKEVLKEEKSYYDFKFEDFKKFYEWLAVNPQARYQVLARLFRSNTVSRIAPNTLIMKPLYEEDHRRIIEENVKAVIQHQTDGGNNALRIEVATDPSLNEFLYNTVVFAPSGARETKDRTKRLLDQVLTVARRGTLGEKEDALDRPRKVLIKAGQDRKSVDVVITPRSYFHGKWSEGEPSTFNLAYDTNSRQLLLPENWLQTVPNSVNTPDPADQDYVTQKDILGARFPKETDLAKGLEAEINKQLLGQAEVAHEFEEEMDQYLARLGAAIKQPLYKVIAGFPGIGKSALLKITAAKLKLPLVGINLQNFTSDDPNAVATLIAELKEKIDKAKEERPDGKYILALEELDKIYEIHPQYGTVVDRPVMAVIKDLLGEGVVKAQIQQGDSSRAIELNVRSAYVAVTMNFGVDLFGFEADPRLTTIEDVMRAYRSISSSQADLRNVLAKIFNPETISRILPNFMIMKPLDEPAYRKLVVQAADLVESERLVDRTRNLNLAQIDLVLTPAYQEYLFRETVIPSEGARYTVVSARDRIWLDLEKALKLFKRNSKYAKKPVELTLDFNPKTAEVSTDLKLKKTGEVFPIAKYPVALNFPPPGIEGPVPEQRLLIAVHEFGHAYSAIRMGLRIEYGTVISPSAGTGGYIKFKQNGISSASETVAGLYSSLASRAMERIFQSKDPRSADSVLDITTGSSSDLKGATEELWAQLFAYGFDPFGGSFLRTGTNASQVGFFNTMTSEEIAAIGRAMRKMEDYLVDEFLRANPREWYVEKILAFARKGSLFEKDFYELLGYQYAGDNSVFLGKVSALHENFKGNTVGLPEEIQKAIDFKQGQTQTTAAENMERALTAFKEILKTEVHGICDKSLKKDPTKDEDKKP